MRQPKREQVMKRAVLASLVLMSLLFLVVSCGKAPGSGMLVLTQVRTGDDPDASLQSLFEGLDVESRIVAFDTNKPNKEPLVLTPEFYAAGSPEISYDGKFMLFAGRRSDEDNWRIWEMDLSKRSVNAITPKELICIDPAYLPGDQVVYSRYVNEEHSPGHYVLERNYRDGKGPQRITYSPDDYRASVVLHDGRILAWSRQVFPIGKAPVLKVLRPDGTKEELFYSPVNKELLPLKPVETDEGRICFAEGPEGFKGSVGLGSVLYSRPFTSHREELYGPAGNLLRILGPSTGGLLLMHRSSPDSRFGISSWNPDKAEMSDVMHDPEYDIVHAVFINPRTRPKKLPSAVDPGEATALLMCQDATLSAVGKQGAVQIELVGTGGSLGIVDLEEDGSVYLRMTADTPFQLQTLDAEGKVLSGPSGWITMRPNERRGCVGCHAGHERAPENRQPLSVRKEPVEIPRISDNIIANNSR